MVQRFQQLKPGDKIILFLVLFFGVGIVGLSLGISREYFARLIPFSLLLGMGLMFRMHRSWKRRHIIIFLLVAILGFVVEMAGVLSGVVFGNYSYGTALGFKLWGTPPMIGLNWLMLIYAVYVFVRKTSVHPVLQVLMGAGLMVAYDVVMEPVAMKLDMWDWAGGVIPLQNYIAWFVISVVLLSIFHLARLRYRNPVAIALFFIQMGFFLALNLLIT